MSSPRQVTNSGSAKAKQRFSLESQRINFSRKVEREKIKGRAHGKTLIRENDNDDDDDGDGLTMDEPPTTSGSPAADAGGAFALETDEELCLLLTEFDRGAKAELKRRYALPCRDGDARAALLDKVFRRLVKEIQKEKEGKRWSPLIGTAVEVIGWAALANSQTFAGGDDGGKFLLSLLREVRSCLLSNASVRATCCKGESKSLMLQILDVMRAAFDLLPSASVASVSRRCLDGSRPPEEEDFPAACVPSRALAILSSILREVAAFSCSVRDAWIWVHEYLGSDADAGRPGEAAIRRQRKRCWRLLVVSAMDAVLGEVRGSETATVFALSGSMGGIICDGCAKWPFNNGFCFMTQICIDRFGSDLEYKPRLFTFVTSDGQGIEGFFEGPFFCLALHTGRTARSDVVHFKHAFRPREWYTLAVQISKPSLVKVSSPSLPPFGLSLPPSLPPSLSLPPAPRRGAPGISELRARPERARYL